MYELQVLEHDGHNVRAQDILTIGRTANCCAGGSGHECPASGSAVPFASPAQGTGSGALSPSSAGTSSRARTAPASSRTAPSSSSRTATPTSAGTPGRDTGIVLRASRRARSDRGRHADGVRRGEQGGRPLHTAALAVTLTVIAG